uniref:BclA C-terminal domain-containing protein n=1 Tax=Siphoviridae sp. ctmIh35 TaxID=2827932 RepID=A0A8S5T8D8_9CAUD|nr:MAG TPA: hypothetical protein [Siphoviridae sp. ctmIh35]
MLNAIAREAQQISAGQNVIFSNTRVKSRRCGCSSGWLNHIEGSGLFTITNRGNQPMAVEVQFNGNVTASAAGETVLTMEVNGEAIGGTEMDYTVATAGVYQNVGASTLIPVPAGTSLIVSVGNISAGAVLVKDANIIIKKLS